MTKSDDHNSNETQSSPWSLAVWLRRFLKRKVLLHTSPTSRWEFNCHSTPRYKSAVTSNNNEKNIYIYNTNLLRDDWNEMASKVPMCKIVIYRCPFVLALCRTGIRKVQVPVTKNHAMLSTAVCQLPAWIRQVPVCFLLGNSPAP